MKYTSILLTGKGSTDKLQITQNELREPAAGEVRLKIICTGVGFTDVIMRTGYYPYAPKLPFVPGYELVGTVDAIGAGVKPELLGKRVAALTVHGGYSEYTYLPPDNLVPVPDGVDAAEALTLVLNYVTAYQMLHRVAKVQAGDSVLITGAGGGVGTALLELGRLAGLKMYGTGSKSKHATISALGGVPLDYTSGDWVKSVREQIGGAGVKAVFDGIGGDYLKRAYPLVAKGGHYVFYGLTGTVKNGKASTIAPLLTLARYGLRKIQPDGRKTAFYGVTTIYRKDTTPFKEDLAKLFDLLAAGKLHPVIVAKMPLRDAAKAQQMLERGAAGGKLILMPDL
jgi:NADPH:quinone reductase